MTIDRARFESLGVDTSSREDGMSLQVTTNVHDDGSATVTIVGDVDISNADELRQAIEAVVEWATPTFIDLTATTYFGSAGVQVLSEQVGRGIELIVTPGSLPGVVLTITALDQELVIHDREA